jgi:hypothetical protein
LYGITVEDVEGVFRDPVSGPATEGTRRVLVGKPAVKFAQRSLKVVYIEEKGCSMVLSA